MGQSKLNIILGVDVGALDKALKGVERKLSRFASNLSSAGQSLTTGLTIPLAALGGASLKAFGDIEKLEKGLTAILGSSDLAAVELKKLKEAAEAPGLSFEQAVKGSIQLQAVGFSADAARTSISALGQAVALTGGSSQELEQVVRQISQINSKGKILAEDFQVIQENAPAIGIALTKAFGTTNIERIRETGISAGEFTEKLIQGINSAEQFQGVTGGMANAFENFKNNAKFAAAELGRTISETIDLEAIMNKLSSAIGSVVTFFKSLTPEARKTILVFAAIVAGIGPLLLIVGKLISLGPLLISGFRGIISVVKGAGAAFAFITSPIGLTIGVILGLVAGLAYLYGRFEGVRRVVNSLVSAFFEFLKILRDIGSAVALFAVGLAQFATGKFSKASDSISAALEKVNGLQIGKRLGEAFATGFNDTSNKIEEGIDFVKGKIFDLTKQVVPQAAAAASAPTVGGFPVGDSPGGSGGGVSNIARAATSELQTIPQLNILPPELLNTQLQGIAQLQLSTAELGLTFQEGMIAFSSEALYAEGNLLRLKENVDALGLSLSANNKAMIDFGKVGALAINSFSSGLNEAIAGTKTFGKAVLSSISDIIGILVKQGVAAIIANTLQVTGKLLGPFAIPIAAAAGSAASALFRKAVGLEKGGIIPPGFPNDTFPARLSSGEAVIPLDRMNQFGGGNGYIAEAVVRGEDLVILMRRAEKTYNRFS